MAETLWSFWIFSFLGWGLERLFAAVTRSPRQRRRCLLFAPLCPVYGLGVLAVPALPQSCLAGWRLYVFGGLTATAVEYLYHWLGEMLLGIRFWDYTAVPGNIRGRVCVPFSLAWGLLLFPAVRLAPVLVALVDEMPAQLTWLCLMAFAADTVCTLRLLSVTHDLEAMRREVYSTSLYFSL